MLVASSVIALDLDGDKDLDLIVGNIHGKFYKIENISIGKELKFAKTVKFNISTGKQLIVPGSKAGICLADWNLDGKTDLILGSGYGIYISKNIGSNAKPSFAKPQLIYKPEKSMGTRFKPTVTDWNSDGLPDLLFGNFSSNGNHRQYHGNIYLLTRKK